MKSGWEVRDKSGSEDQHAQAPSPSSDPASRCEGQQDCRPASVTPTDLSDAWAARAERGDNN